MMQRYEATPAVYGYPDLITMLKMEMGVPDDLEVLYMVSGMAKSGVLYRISPDENWLIEVYETARRMELIIDDDEINPMIFEEDG
jgi:hypothetical protein